MKHVCGSCLAVVSSIEILYQHTERCIKQQPTKISFSWKDRLKFEDNNMKIDFPFKVYEDFECFIRPQNDPKVLNKQNPIAVEYYLIAP